MGSDDERRAWAVPELTGELDGLDLSLVDRSDQDERQILIEAEHPHLRRALHAGHDEILVDGQVVNPRLHIAMHEIVAEQLWHDDPPEMWETAKRLTALGYDRHEVLHMLASVVSADVHRAWHDHVPYDPARTRAALAALPESWEALREPQPSNRAERRAQSRADRRRRR